MNAEILKETFFTMVAPDVPNEWDVEEAVADLSRLDGEKCEAVLGHVQAIWPVSHSLCFDYLKMAASALDCIETGYLAEWVNRTLDQYEKNGLRSAQRYMGDVEKNFLCTLRGESGLQFGEAAGRLRPYLRGLSGSSLDLAPSDTVSTDTSTIFLPRAITWSRDNDENFFLYKLIVSYQWAYIAGSTFTVSPGNTSDDPKHLWLQDFLESFPCFELARDLYFFLETVRLSSFLEEELPGLMRQKRKMYRDDGPAWQDRRKDQGILADLQLAWSTGRLQSGNSSELKPFLEVLDDHEARSSAAMDSVAATRKLYTMLEPEAGDGSGITPFIFQGTLDLKAVCAARMQRINESKELFVNALATRILAQSRKSGNAGPMEQAPDASGGKTEKPSIAMVVSGQGENQPESAHSTVVISINNEEVDAGPELEQAASNVISELGFLPDKYISSAVGRAGKGYAAFRAGGSEKGGEIVAPITYDEWDYRRSDYRKNWCSVQEKEIPLSHSTFLARTIEKYHGQIVRLRYQFEMMRTRERFVRRQRDGDDIDLDALVESLADTRAGLPPSDRLFVRLRRDERDIAVLFLIDMSNSTQGWVSRVIKESLIMLCEALEVVGDRYGIYGFSGMRRLRSDFFHIKHLDEHYDEAVKQRISSIAPCEYTRMGPAIRHATSLLRDVDSRVKLMLTLSDGKPEDYDDYKGEYAIEDTRHALIEARAAAIHPFCITIDHHAHDYMAHMYGERNYIQIDDAGKLPGKMPEIYRVLTT
jgi:nitric oxide reductase NorD protein